MTKILLINEARGGLGKSLVSHRLALTFARYRLVLDQGTAQRFPRPDSKQPPSIKTTAFRHGH
jgi:hypothetical protein